MPITVLPERSVRRAGRSPGQARAGFFELPEILVRQDNTHPVFASLGEHSGDIARQVQLAFVQIEEERSLRVLSPLRIKEKRNRVSRRPRSSHDMSDARGPPERFTRMM